MPICIALGEIRPFSKWSAKKPTQSLSWYMAYNNTKHDREGKLSQASVGALVDAVAAVYIMLASQIGTSMLRHGALEIKDVLPVQPPQWSAKEIYGPPRWWEYDGSAAGARRHPPGWTRLLKAEWKDVRYPFR